MRDKGGWSSTTYETTTREIAKSGKSVTELGEQHVRTHGRLDPLVDPKTHGVKRESLSLMSPQGDGTFLLLEGVAIPVKTGLDTTGSMGDNVARAFKVLPKAQHYLVQGEGALLESYHVQIATAVIQDVEDKIPYQHSEFEPDNEVDRQMRLLSPEGGGGDAPEDYDLDIFYTAERTVTSISGYGLKGYHFIVGDEIGRGRLGEHAMQKAFGLSSQGVPSTEELAQKLLQGWHGFYLQVGDHLHTTEWWRRMLGSDRVVLLPSTDDLAEVQAAIIGLTEGKLDLQSALDFLTDTARVSKAKARQIVQAVAHIPLRAQAILPNHGKLPTKGSIFASRTDLWPINEPHGIIEEEPAHVGTSPVAGGIDWKL
ncbi:MAG TPA: hypothetical protein VLA04_06740 [Verrucomicrobiae bacterium]|nr:hypothetical protein [Verrucomicrobiae bacterium]